MRLMYGLGTYVSDIQQAHKPISQKLGTRIPVAHTDVPKDSMRIKYACTRQTYGIRRAFQFLSMLVFGTLKHSIFLKSDMNILPRISLYCI